MPKWSKSIIAVLLLPVCVAAVATLFRVIRAAGDALEVWIPFGAGVACWLTVFLMLPRQTWLYVLGHELTHAVWGWAFGGELLEFKAGAKSGRVVLTRTNFLIALAPYFFPLYAVLAVVVFGVWNWVRPFALLPSVFHLVLGAAYAFHVTWTWEIVRTRQSDLEGQGYLFSAVVVCLGNVIVMFAGIALLAGKPGLVTALGWWLESCLTVYSQFGVWLAKIAGR